MIDIPKNQTLAQAMGWNMDHRQDMREAVREIAQAKPDPIGWLLDQLSNNQLRGLVMGAQQKSK
jgi:hypothetical protein